jgi:ABC-type dipeptide/oligopeptide/nickel transport system permease subunit
VSAVAETGGLTAVAGKSPGRLFWERFREDKAAVAGGVIVFILIFVAFFGGPLAQHYTGHPQNLPLDNGLSDAGLPAGPSSSLPFGADAQGRDLLVRTLYGARTSLVVGVVASALALMIGLVVGLLAGFYGRWVDTALSRSADVMLAVPQLLIAVGIVAACNTSKNGCLGGTIQQGLTVVILVITLFSWSYIARLVRGYTLSLREKDFVEASRSLGASNARIIGREILPNLIGPLIVYMTLLIPQNILFEAALSFLGLGVPPTQASWGQILSDAFTSDLYLTSWWLMLFPGAFLVLTTLAFNLLGDGLRDAFDVRTER